MRPMIVTKHVHWACRIAVTAGILTCCIGGASRAAADTQPEVSGANPDLGTAGLHASSTQRALTLQEYIAELDRCSQALSVSVGDKTALRNLRISIPDNWTVQEGNTTYTVSTEWLEQAVARIESDPAANKNLATAILKKLAAYREAGRSMQESEGAEMAETSRATLNQILAAKEFRSEHGPSWLDVQKARLYDWLARHILALLGRMGRARTIGNVIAWSVIALAGLLLLFWTVGASTGRGSQAAMDLRGATSPPRNWHYWLREAREAAARGDHRSAIHAGYWAAITQLEETRALPEDRSRTPRESLRLIEKASSSYAPLLNLTRRFELVWYGYRSATAADWSDAMQQLETLGCLRSSTPATADC